MKSVYDDIVKALSDKESVVSVTIFNKSGSAPRDSGAKMMVKSDGSITGTIGGGKLEAEAMRMAAEVFKTKKPAAKAFNLTGADASEMNMICGGAGEFLLDYIDSQDPVNLELYNSIIDVRNRREKAWLITGIGTGKQNIGDKQQCLIKQDHSFIGKFESDATFLTKLIQGPARISIHSEVREDQRILVEPIMNTSTVYIFGAGHVSMQIAPVAELVGFRTVVIDDRAEYANSLRFPSSEIVLLKSFDDPLPDFSFDEGSYLVIVTRGHLYDKTVLQQIIRKPVPYIGMIGSRSKRNILYKKLSEEFGFGDDDFARVHSPIGLDIKAESPEEIAVSIVAELIQERANQDKCAEKIKL